jgi:hypothetical protein
MQDLISEQAQLDLEWRSRFGQPVPILGALDVVRRILAETAPESRNWSIGIDPAFPAPTSLPALDATVEPAPLVGDSLLRTMPATFALSEPFREAP